MFEPYRFAVERNFSPIVPIRLPAGARSGPGMLTTFILY
jgi:hypothetical protein